MAKKVKELSEEQKAAKQKEAELIANARKAMVPSNFFEAIFMYYKKNWHMSLGIVAFIIINVLCAVAIPLVTYQMTTSITTMDQGVAGAPIPFWGLHWDVMLYIGLGVVAINLIAQFFSQWIAVALGKRVEIDLRNKALEALVKQDISYYSDKRIGELITKVIGDTQIVGDQISTVPVSLISAMLQIIAAIIMMCIFDWKLTLVALAAFLVVLFGMGIAFGAVKKRITDVRETITDINGNVTDRISTVRLVKSTGTENYEVERFKEVHQKYYKKALVLAKVQALMVTILFGGISVMQFAVIGAAAIIHSGAAELSFWATTFSAFNLSLSVLISPLFSIVMASVGIAQASVSAKRVAETIVAPSRMDPHYNDGIQVEKLDGAIKFKGVEFAYPEKPEKVILPKFDFTFEKGKSYAFVGETGSGKSTIAKLLLRFYDPSQGDVMINGGKTNLKDVNLKSFLDHVGYVEQEPQILFGDVYENIRYGSFNASNEEIVEAAKKADLHDLIMSWPQGYETILGERGFMLSGGQKQRLVIARMFLKDPELLILDEATSALDNIVEKEIQGHLEKLMVGRTTVSIAHRLSTIKNVDEIIVLGPGKGIVQTGTFDELKSKPGHFQNLYKAGLMD